MGFRTKPLISKNNSKGLCILNFLFYWLAERDTGHRISSSVCDHVWLYKLQYGE